MYHTSNYYLVYSSRAACWHVRGWF